MAERLRLDIDPESYQRLIELAVIERRPVAWEAEWLLIRAIAERWSPSLRSESPELEPVSAGETGL
jgi:hypothetical protein